jgi:chromosome segregation ATPase
VALFKKKTASAKRNGKLSPAADINLDMAILRQNNITRLTIDERWTKLFVGVPLCPELAKAQDEMNELIKKEAMLKNEQDSLEPAKKKCMNLIIGLTKEAFENNSDKAKSRLKECRKEIERINDRMNRILEDIEKTNDQLKEANVKLLNDTVRYIFTTLKNNKDRANAINEELAALAAREAELKTELESISLDWTSYAVNLTELLGADLVKRLEEEYGLGDLKNETDNSGTDEKD